MKILILILSTILPSLFAGQHLNINIVYYDVQPDEIPSIAHINITISQGTEIFYNTTLYKPIQKYNDIVTEQLNINTNLLDGMYNLTVTVKVRNITYEKKVGIMVKSVDFKGMYYKITENDVRLLYLLSSYSEKEFSLPLELTVYKDSRVVQHIRKDFVISKDLTPVAFTIPKPNETGVYEFTLSYTINDKEYTVSSNEILIVASQKQQIETYRKIMTIVASVIVLILIIRTLTSH